MTIDRNWFGYWINNDRFMCAPSESVDNAPYLRKTFECTVVPGKAVIHLCALGWHELYINGHKADQRVLAPVVTQFDKRVSYISYDVTALIKCGKNAVTVLLGNGWYNCHSAEVWSFDKAPWRDWPKLLCDIEIDGKVVAWSDRSWLYHDSPIIFDALRNGETYDARLEIPGVFDVDFDDSEWKNATQANPPGGIIVEEDLEPCMIMKEYEPVANWELAPGMEIYDFGTNLTGWCLITAEGEAGAQITISHTEQFRSKDDLYPNHINAFILKGDFQTDRYILKGGGPEIFHPHFTYHGFRYACITFPKGKKVRLLAIKAQMIHNNFAETGHFESSSPILNRLQQITMQSFLCNFTGIPTDCPHREKNGWTGDANMACETGLWNRRSVNAYKHFLRIMADTQRPSGQFPGIVPSGGWGYNWGSGPAWDSMIFEGCYQIYRFTGDLSIVAEMYDNMKKYLEYCRSRSEDNLIWFGLGDWCHWKPERMVPVEFTSSCYFYSDAVRMTFFAELLGKEDDAGYFKKLAGDIKRSFNKKYYRGDGMWASGVMTALAAPLFFGIAEKDQEKTAALLVKTVRQNDAKIDFGMLGAKYVPRVLCEYGYGADAYNILTQEEFPGWGYLVKQNATTLWEDWSGKNSQNHILFGDVSAWMYEFPGGISPDINEPGFKRVILRPVFIPQLEWVNVRFASVAGEITVNWKRQDGEIYYTAQLPEGTSGKLYMPDGTVRDVAGYVECTF